MKKFILVAAWLPVVLFAIQASAQRIQYGIKAGLNYSGINNYQKNIYQAFPELPPGLTFDSKPYIKFHGGAFVRFTLTQKLALQPEILYSQQGYHFDSQFMNSTVDLYIRQSYVNIPVLLQYKLCKGLHVTAGPQLGILLKGELSANFQNLHETRDAKFKKTDLSLAFGAGYQLPVLPLGFYLRYTTGLNNINNDPNRDYTLRNQVAQAGVFYQFGK
jgi:hypothetical protein